MSNKSDGSQYAPGPGPGRRRPLAAPFRGAIAAGLAVAVLALSGCKLRTFEQAWWVNGFLDPSQLGQPYLLHDGGSKTVGIIDRISIQDSPDSLRAEPPTEDDLSVLISDYVLKPGDIITVSVFELFDPRQEQGSTREIGQLGFVTLPFLGVIRAADKTTRQLEQELADQLRGDILRDPKVSVILLSERQNRFYALGAIRPGEFPIPRADYRVLDALAQLGDVPFRDLQTLYIIRQRKPRIRYDQDQLQAYERDEQRRIESGASGRDPQSQPSMDDGDDFPAARPGPTDIPVPGEQGSIRQRSADGLTLDLPAILRQPGDDRNAGLADDARTLQSALSDNPSRDTRFMSSVGEDPEARAMQAVLDEGLLVDPAIPQLRPATTQPSTAAGDLSLARDEMQTESTMVFMNGEWVELRTERKAPPPQGRGFDWLAMMEEAPGTRVIAIPIESIRRGDPRFNVIIRDGDLIYVPPFDEGAFFIGGNVGRPGTYGTSPGLTLMQAIIASGGLSSLGWPENCQIVRRVGPDKQEFIIVDLDAIFAGRAPDLFIKRHDVINVGSHISTTFLAAIRNGFQVEYGFDFQYARNFYGNDGFSLTPNNDIPRGAGSPRRNLLINSLRSGIGNFGLP